MKPSELAHAGYFFTSNPWDIRVDFVRHNHTRTVGTIWYDRDDNHLLSMDQRLGKAYELARIDFVKRRLDGEVINVSDDR